MSTTFAPDLFRGQVVVVTGGGTGIGLSLCRAFAELGAGVCIASRKPENLEAGKTALAAMGANVLAVPTDIRDADAVEQLMARTEEHFGRIDILINNAGANFLAPAAQMTANGWRTIVDIVLTGNFLCSQAAARRMTAQRRGRIVMNAGANGVNGSPLMAHSGAAKAGLINLVKSLAVEWAPFGITVNAVAPGPVETPGATKRLWPSEAVRESIRKRVPLGRFLTPEDCVGPFLFLCSAAASMITGETLVVDGGSTCRTLPEDWMA